MEKKVKKQKVDIKKLISKMNFDDILLRRNFIEFKYVSDDKKVVEKLRIRKSNTGEELEARDKKNELRVKLLQDDKYLTRKQLIEVYKKKGIDIDEFDEKWDDLKKEIDSTSCVLTELNNTPKEKPDEIERLKGKIRELEAQQFEITTEKTNLLSYCIEDQVIHSWYMYTTYLGTEISKDKKWVRKWKTYDDMMKDDTEIVSLCLVKNMEFVAGFSIDIEV